MFILDDLLIKLPAKGFYNIVKKLTDMVEEELNDDSKIKEQLLELQTLFVTDQIAEEEYMRREDELIERLNQIRERKETS